MPFAIELLFFFFTSLHLAALSIMILNNLPLLNALQANDLWLTGPFFAYNLLIIVAIYEILEGIASFFIENDITKPSLTRLAEMIFDFNSFYLTSVMLLNSFGLYYILSSLAEIMELHPTWNQLPLYFLHIFAAKWLVFILLNFMMVGVSRICGADRKYSKVNLDYAEKSEKSALLEGEQV